MKLKKKLEKDNFPEAIEIFLRLINLLPENENIGLNLGVALFKNKEYSLASYFFEEMINKYPSNAMLYYYAGLSANNLNNVEKAYAFSNKALELKPTLADILFNGKFSHFKKNYEELELIYCPLCNETNLEAVNVINQSVNSLNFNIINPLRKWDMCIGCGLIFANPRPTEKALKNYSFELAFQTGKIPEADIDKILEETNAYDERLNIIDNLSVSGKLLDINAEYGNFITIAKNRDWNVTALEANTLKFNQLEEIIGVELKNISLSELEHSDTYDLVTMWETIEKTTDFMQALKKIHNLLKSGGIFAFSFHGNDTYLSEKMEFSYPLWYYPDALYFFNIVLLKKEIKKLGFNIEKVRVTGRKNMANVEFYCRKL